MAQFKISEYPAKTVFNDGDLYDISTYDGVSAYTSEKLTFAQLKTELNSALSFVSSNLYTADGTLTGNRTVTMGGNTLAFNGNTVSVGNSLVINPTKVGVDGVWIGSLGSSGGALTDERLFINGQTKLGGAVEIGSGSAREGLLTFAAGSFVEMYAWTGRGLKFYTNASLKATILSSGEFGIGISTPSEKLHVNGNAQVDGDLILNNGLTNLGYTSSAAAPTTTELPTDKDYSIHKDTVGGTVYLAYNDGGVIKTVTLT